MSVLHPQTFARCAAQHPLRRKPRGLSVYDHFLALCFAQLTYRESLRGLEACLNARPSLRYHLGFRGRITRTNLAYANERRDWRLFATLAQVLMRRARQLYAAEPQDIELPEAAFALDASLIHLSARLFPWVEDNWQSATAIKLHALLDLRGNVPAWAALSPGRFQDVRMLDQLPVQPGCFYVMDRGYLNFRRLRSIAQQRAFFVVRSRYKLGFVARRSMPVDRRGSLRCDQKIALTIPHSKRAYPEPLRRVKVHDARRKKSLVLLTNHFSLPAQTVADLYKRRWQIELFFKWIKQNLRIARFMGTSENAVRTQIATAFIAYMLIHLAQAKLAVAHRASIILTVVRGQLFTRRPLAYLLDPPPIPRRGPNPQLALWPATI